MIFWQQWDTAPHRHRFSGRLPQLCFWQWKWGEATPGWRLLGFLQGWGAASRAGLRVGRPSELRMLAEECLNDGPGNLSWGELEMKTQRQQGRKQGPMSC